jgi:release factor glutamine methyltransferase
LNLATALRQGTELLEKDSLTVPRLTAEVLLAHVLGCERAYLYAHPEQDLTDVQQLHFGRYLHERLKHKPTQYITGRQEFYGRLFRVTPAVLIPRPETEHVVEQALHRAGEAGVVLDVGTGSGCLAVTLQAERPAAQVMACDISREALAVARDNAARLAAPVRFFCGDLLEAVRPESVDVIVSNPPYVPEQESLPPEVAGYEPGAALFAGPDGMSAYRRLLARAASVLRPGGWLIMELGHDSRAKVEALLGSAWAACAVTADLAGIDRVMALRRATLDSPSPHSL